MWGEPKTFSNSNLGKKVGKPQKRGTPSIVPPKKQQLEDFGAGNFTEINFVLIAILVFLIGSLFVQGLINRKPRKLRKSDGNFKKERGRVEHRTAGRRWFFKMVNADGYVKTPSGRLEHRMIAEGVLGRRLRRWEVVHHMNGKRDDNRPENLCVMHRRDHDKYHDWYDWIKKKFGKPPGRVKQLKKLRGDCKGTLLSDVLDEKVVGRVGR